MAGLFSVLIYLPALISEQVKTAEEPTEEPIILLDSTKIVQQGVIQGGFIIQIGKHYIIDLNLYSWNENNPFRIPDLKEVVVLDIKQGYVLYKYIDSNRESSNDIEFFAKKFKPKN
jgi:hypothetical protein